MSETPQTVFITKYALTAGIKEAKVVRLDADGYMRVVWASGCNGEESFSKSNWAETRERAAKQAEAMRDKKLKSLEKQSAALRKLMFT